MANQFKKALAVALVAATTLSYVTPVSQLMVPASISLAAESDKIVVDSALGETLSVAKGTATTITLPSAENEMINGVSTKVTYTVATENKSVVGLKQKSGSAFVDVAGTEVTYDVTAGNTIQFVGLAGGKSKVTITKKTADTVLGVQTVEVTVVEKAGLTLAATGALSGGAIISDTEFAADSTIKVYKGEALKIAATTTTTAAQIDVDKDFTTVVGDSSVASVVKENKTDKVGVITPSNVYKEAVSGQTYTVYFEANKVGSTTVTIGQAAAKDSSTSATSASFKIEVIERDGELSAEYDYDRDGKAESYAADKFDTVKFVTKEATKDVALDLKSNKTIQIAAKSGNGQAISYTSSNPAIATVSNNGLVTAVAKGSTTIKVATAASGTSNIKASEIEIKINVTENEVAYITVSGEASASSVGTYNGTSVPDITVGTAIANDADAYTKVINSDDKNKAVVLSTKDKKTAQLSVISNAGSGYIEAVSSDTGVFTYDAATGTITAVKAGAGTLTISTKAGAPVESSSKVIINVYVTDLNANNSITASAAKVDAVSKTAAIAASAAYGDVVFDGKVYKYDAEKETYDAGAASVDGITVDAKGNVTFAPAGKSGTVYAKASVANSEKALGAKDVYVAIDYLATAVNNITVTGATKDVVNVTEGSSVTLNVSATDAKTVFVVTPSDEDIATATIADGVITVNGLSAGSTKLLIKGIAGTAGYADPEPTSVVITVAKKEAAVNPLKVSAKKVTIKAATLKKKNQTLAVSKVLSVSGNETPVTFTKKSGNAKITIAKSTGKVTVKKGLKKGTYKVKINVKAAKSDEFKSASKTVTVTFKVK